MNKSALIAVVLIAGGVVGYFVLRRHMARSSSAAAAAPGPAAGPDQASAAATPEGSSAPTPPPAASPQPGARTPPVLPAPSQPGAGAAPPALPGTAFSGQQLMNHDPVALRYIQSGLNKGVRPALRSCVNGASDRGSLSKGLNVSLRLEVKSHESRAQVVDVAADWPDDIDPTLRDCIIAGFAGVELATDDFDFDYTVDYPIRIRPQPVR